MDKPSSSRIQSAGDRRPDSDTARSGFGSRAQSAADRNAAADEAEEAD
jgi:hypothetical protein